MCLLCPRDAQNARQWATQTSRRSASCSAPQADGDPSSVSSHTSNCKHHPMAAEGGQVTPAWATAQHHCVPSVTKCWGSRWQMRCLCIPAPLHLPTPPFQSCRLQCPTKDQAQPLCQGQGGSCLPSLCHIYSVARRFSCASGQHRGQSMGLKLWGQTKLRGMGMLEGWDGASPGV